jgi:hypothetical protein
MKLKTIPRMGAAIVAALALTSAAQALPFLNGVINMGTDFNVGGAGIILQDAGSATTTNLSLAAGVQSWVGVIVTSASGDFTGNNGTAVAFATPWVFAASTNPLWSVNGFSFDLAAGAAVSTPGSFLLVEGNGMLKKAGYADTPGHWTFSTQGQAAQGEFSWSSSTNSVPDGGTTVALLGFSLLGLHGVRRKFVKR